MMTAANAKFRWKALAAAVFTGAVLVFCSVEIIAAYLLFTAIAIALVLW